MTQKRMRPTAERAAFLGQFLTKRLGYKGWCMQVDPECIDERYKETSLATLATGKSTFQEACVELRVHSGDAILVELGLLSYSRADMENPEWQAEMLALNDAIKATVVERRVNYKFKRPKLKRRRRTRTKISPVG